MQDFTTACESGDLKFAKQLYYSSPSIDLNLHYDNYFSTACDNGHLNIAQWLHELNVYSPIWP